jgi:Family of unknown function (DUF5681)
MSRRKTPGSPDGDSNDYEVGYGRPPTHTRFRAGQSGNPAGRRKGVRNLVTDVKRMLATPVKVKEGGRARTKSTQEAALALLREEALRREWRSLARLLELAGRFNNDAAEIGPAQALAPDDRAILSAYEAEIVAAAMTAAAPKSPEDPTSNPAASSRRKRLLNE